MADGDITLSNNPNVDTALIEKNGKLLRVVLQETPAGTLELSDSPNVDTGYIIDSDGYKHKVHLVSEVSGTLETGNSVNSGIGYVTDGDGKKHKVLLTASLSGGDSPTRFLEFDVDENEKLIYANVSQIIDLSGCKTIDLGYVFYGVYEFNTNLTGTLDLSDIETINGIAGHCCEKMFNSCQNVTGVNLSSLKAVQTVSGCSQMFSHCSGITNIDLSSLEELSGTQCCKNMFNTCSALTSVTFNSLKTVTGTNACQGMFANCTGLTSLSFPALTSTSFGSKTNQFNTMLTGCSNVTVHFPSNIQSVIGSWSDVTAGFSGTNTTILYDLPATE